MTSAEDDFGAFFESLLEGDQAVSRCGGRSPTVHPSLYFPLHDQQEQQQADKLKQLVEQQQHQHQPHQQHQQDQQQHQDQQQQHEQQRQHEQPQSAGPQWAADNVAQPEEARKERRQQNQQEGRASERQQLQQFLHRAQSDEQQHTEFQREQPREQQQAKIGGKQQLEAAVSSLSTAAAALSKYEAKQRPQQHVRVQQANSAGAPSFDAEILRSGDAAASTSGQAAAVERRESNAPAVAVDISAHATFAAAAGPRDRATAGDCAFAASSEGGAAAAAAATAVPTASRGGDPAATAAESSSAANAVGLAHAAGPLTARAAVLSSAAAVSGGEGLDGRAAAETPVEGEQRQPVSALVAYPARLPSSNKLSSAAACADTSASHPRENPAACSPAAASAVSLVAEAIRGGPSAHASERVPPLPSADGGVATSSRPLQLQPARQQSLGTVDCSSSSGSRNKETSSSREYLSRSNSSDSFMRGESFERKGFEEEARAAIAALKSRRTSTAEEADAPAGAPSCATTAAAVAAGERGAVQEQQQKGNEQQTAATVKRAAAEESFLQELCQPPGRKTRKVVLPNLGLGEEQEWQQPQEPQRPQGPQPQAGRWWSAPPELDPFPPYRFSMRESEAGRDEASSSRTSSGSSKGSSSSRSSIWNSKSLSSKKANSSKGSDCKTDRQNSSGGSGSPLETVQQDMAFSAEAVSRVIEAKLLENQQMIFAIHENLGGGRFEQAVCFFERLQQNLLFLALLADQQPEQQLGKLRAPEQQDQGATEGGDVMGEREQQDFYQNNADFWNHEETQRLYHALRTPYLDLRQLSAAVYSKDPQQVLTYLMRTADCYLNYSRGIPDPGFEGNGVQPQVQMPQQNLRSEAGQEQSFLASVGSGDRRLATQSSVSGELPKCRRVPYQLTLQKTEPCSESWGAPAVDAVHRNLREDTKVREQPQQQKQRPPDQSDTLCDDPGGREAAEQVEGPPDRQSDDHLAVKETKVADGFKTTASP